MPPSFKFFPSSFWLKHGDFSRDFPSPCHLRIRAQIHFPQPLFLLFTRYRFIHTLKMASERQDYQNLVKTHTKQFGSIHNKKQFLAWHRWYLLKMENILREVDPIVTVPYWDWSLWSGEPWLNEVFHFGSLLWPWRDFSTVTGGISVDGFPNRCWTKLREEFNRAWLLP